jgi:hypothetical protein
MASPGLRLFIQQVLIELEREQALNLVSGSPHSTSTITYHLSIALLTVIHHEMRVIRINRKEDLNVSTMSSNSYKLNVQPYGIINKAQI